MRKTDISAKIKEYAKKNNFIAGICGVDKLPPPTGVIPFSNYSEQQRTDPRLMMDTARSIIVVGVGYAKKQEFINDGCRRGVFSMGAIGLDYHIDVIRVLEGLKDYLYSLNLKFDCITSVDTGPLPERTLAVRAGLGWRGKNGNIFSEKFGSLFNIGYMLTSLELETDSDKIAFDGCGNCTVCINECKTGALQTDGSFDYTKCVSYLTQKKGELTTWERKAIGPNLYGCDTCQTCCSYNREKFVGVVTDINESRPLLSDITSMDKAGFKQRFGQTAIYWRGLNIIKRNAETAMYNLEKRGDT